MSAAELFSIALLLRAIASFLLGLHFWASPLLPAGLLNNPSWPLSTAGDAVAAVVLGPFSALGASWVSVGVTAGHASLAHRMLRPSRKDELADRVRTLTETRTRAVDEAERERRRIERDLHDGAQQRLVALALDLGMARRKLDSDPDEAKELVAGAHEEAKRALADLRDLVRGIHPAVLTDRGLDAAISALAVRCPVPVDIDIRLPERLPETVESTAYFFVAEALTNVARHSRASAASVRASLDAGNLRVVVGDDGIGGAGFDGGTGLAGLRDRLAALDGRLELHSPTGGPTEMSMEVPCGL
jgi:signal transduction histidine kinase